MVFFKILKYAVMTSGEKKERSLGFQSAESVHTRGGNLICCWWPDRQTDYINMCPGPGETHRPRVPLEKLRERV
jgi:hypothetical protein